ncbi:MAG: ankyrin repeat domain-containing protein, partial [Acidobacteria bacterium]
LHEAARYGYLEIARLLISSGANVNAKDQDGQTPLHEAAWYGNSGVAKLLISSRADLNAKNKNGKTPLGVASRNTREAIKEYLKDQQKMTNIHPLDP